MGPFPTLSGSARMARNSHFRSYIYKHVAYNYVYIIIELGFVNVIWTIPKFAVAMCVMCVCVFVA